VDVPRLRVLQEVHQVAEALLLAEAHPEVHPELLRDAAALQKEDLLHAVLPQEEAADPEVLLQEAVPHRDAVHQEEVHPPAGVHQAGKDVRIIANPKPVSSFGLAGFFIG